ncbi:hypothetical protein Dimus_007258 [Dionaea muscipula]
MFRTSEIFLLHVLVIAIATSLLLPSALSIFPQEPADSVHFSVTTTTTADIRPQTEIPSTPVLLPVPHRPGRKSLPDGPALEFLVAHNKIRAQYREPPLKYSRRLARFAHRHGRTLLTNCTGIHSDGPYGENIFWARKKYWSPTRIVNSWASEAMSYDARTRNCSSGIHGCGHFTQIVWRDTLKVGCQLMPCVGRGVIGICNYDPPGNYVNESPFDSIHWKSPPAGVPPSPVAAAAAPPPPPPPPPQAVEPVGSAFWRLHHFVSSKIFSDPQSMPAAPVSTVASAVSRLRRHAAAAAARLYGNHARN